MFGLPVVTGTTVFLVYVFAFGGAALVCVGSLWRARRITDPDTRRGLVALLVTSGGWAAVHVLFLVIPTPTLKLAVYEFGLIVGFSTVGAWLYFCSAYTGRTLHRSQTIRWLAIGVFLVVIAVKLTNPLHHSYFQTELVGTPFPHLAVQNHLLHWVVMGLAYALALIGYFMLVEMFWQVGHDTTPLVGLVALTSLPALFDLVGFRSSFLLNITHEPLGVAAFTVGVLYLYIDDFQTVRLTGSHDDPVVVVDDDNRVRDYNTQAKELFADVTTGEPFGPAIPDVAEYLDTDDAVIEVDRAGGMRYYKLSINPLMSGQSRLGRVITFADITNREQYRQELEGENDRLDQFASMVSHDLRNPLTVAMARVEAAKRSGDVAHLDDAGAALTRMETLIDDVLALARQGQIIDEREQVTLSTIADETWGVVATDDASVTVESDLTFYADRDRLQRLFENTFRNALDHSSGPVTIRVGALSKQTGFYIADDGPGIPAQQRESVFESGHSTADEGSGFGLAIVEEIVDAHDWMITVTESTDGGARFEITGVEQIAGQ